MLCVDNNLIIRLTHIHAHQSLLSFLHNMLNCNIKFCHLAHWNLITVIKIRCFSAYGGS